MKKIVVLFLLLSVSCLFVTCDKENEWHNDLKIKVVDAGNEPLDSVIVLVSKSRIYNDKIIELFKITTDTNGECFIQDVDKRYNVSYEYKIEVNTIGPLMSVYSQYTTTLSRYEIKDGITARLEKNEEEVKE